MEDLLAAGTVGPGAMTAPGAGARVDGNPHRAALVVRPRDIEVVVTPDLLADLHDPTLVISHGYIGPDRRLPGLPAPRIVPTWMRRVLTVVFLTALVVVPLTLIAARAVPPPAAGTRPATPSATAAPTGPTARSTAQEARRAAVTARKAARAEVAHERTLARAESMVPAATTAPAAPPVPAGHRQNAVDTSSVRSEAHAATAQARTAAREAEVRARLDRQAERATTRAQVRQARMAARVGPGVT